MHITVPKHEQLQQHVSNAKASPRPVPVYLDGGPNGFVNVHADDRTVGVQPQVVQRLAGHSLHGGRFQRLGNLREQTRLGDDVHDGASCIVQRRVKGNNDK